MENIQDFTGHEFGGRGRGGRPERTGSDEAGRRGRRRGRSDGHGRGADFGTHHGDLGPRGDHGPRDEFPRRRRGGRGPERVRHDRGRAGGHSGDELRDLTLQLTGAVRQAASGGTPEQAQATAAVLAEAKRAIYRILADDTTLATSTTTT